MIRFIYGDFGFGKTHEIINMIKRDAELGVRSFLIVPDQQAVVSERMLLDALPAKAQLTTEVLGFSRLYNRVCREYGGLEYNYITAPAKHLIMWKNLRELAPMLEHYKSTDTDDISLSEVMLAALGECRANAISPSKLEAVTEKLDKTSDFYHKMRDISLIYALYNSSVCEKFSDSADDISKLSDMLGKHRFFENSNVYIDAFTSFTAAEHAVIDEIFAQAKNTTITISLPEPRYTSMYTQTLSDSERRLRRSADEHGGAECVTLTENRRAQSQTLAYLSKNLWKMSDVTPFEYTENTPDTSVVLESARDPYAESEAAARWARELIKSGTRCRDIVVIARNAESYRGIIEPAFEREGVPFYFSEKSDISSKSAVKFLLSALMIKNKGWRAGDVISHVKCGFYDISADQADMLESYVTTWRIKGAAFTEDYWTMNPDGYQSVMSERGAHILTEANYAKDVLRSRLIPLFARLDAADGATEMCRAIYEYLCECGIEEKLSERAKKSASIGNAKEAQEYLSLYPLILNALSMIATVLEDTDINTAELATALRLVFDMSDIGTIPTSVDQVTVGSASTLRAGSTKCVIVLGLSDGEFPRAVTDAGILNSPEREKLAELGLRFSSDIEEKMSDELLFVKRAFALASERLILITPRAEISGRVKQPSIAYTRARALLPHIKEHKFEESDLSYLSISAESALRYIHENAPDEELAALRAALIDVGESEDELLRSPEDISTDECSVSEESAKLAFPDALELSQSRLEKFVNCKFSYYCSYVLDLREEKEAAFKASQMGTFIHFLLEHLIKELVCGETPLSEISEDRICELTDEVTERYIAEVCPESRRKKGSLVHLYRRLRNLALLLAKNIIEEFSHSEFRPEFFELNIKKASGGTPLFSFTLKDGSTLTIKGVVDRVDVLRRDGNVYVRVVDYKTGSKEFSLDDLKLGLNMQMLIYLFALCSSGAKKIFSEKAGADTPAPTPAGIVYLSSNIPTLELEDYKEPDEVLALARTALDRNGLLLADEDILKAMNDALSPAFLAGVKKDKKGALAGKALTTAERFEELKSEISETILAIAHEMKSGAASATPLLHKRSLPCDWCEMKHICRRIERSEQKTSEGGNA